MKRGWDEIVGVGRGFMLTTGPRRYDRALRWGVIALALLDLAVLAVILFYLL